MRMSKIKDNSRKAAEAIAESVQPNRTTTVKVLRTWWSNTTL